MHSADNVYVKAIQRYEAALNALAKQQPHQSRPDEALAMMNELNLGVRKNINEILSRLCDTITQPIAAERRTKTGGHGAGAH